MPDLASTESGDFYFIDCPMNRGGLGARSLNIESAPVGGGQLGVEKR